MNTVIKTARGFGIFAGVFYLVGAVIDIPYSHWHLVAFLTGALFLLPWKRVAHSRAWWPAYICLCLVVILLVVSQAKAIFATAGSKTFVNACWIVIELAQPLAISMIRRRPEQSPPAYPEGRADAPSGSAEA